MNTVYRVEYKLEDGRTFGAFTAQYHTECEKVKGACNYFLNNLTGYHPEPWEDDCDVDSFAFNMLCGCTHVWQIFEWFGRCSLEKLLLAGFTISVYDVSEIKEGNTQCCFYEKHAIKTGELSIEEALDLYQEEF